MDQSPLLGDSNYSEVARQGDSPSPNKGEKKYHRHSWRWFILTMFIFCGISNAMVMLSFSPIFGLSTEYFGPAFGGSSTPGTATAVNLLATLFQIMYIPGTYKAAKVLKGNRIRDAVLQGMAYTFLGNTLRYFTANAYSQRDPFDESFETSTLNYILIFLGTILVAIAQPIFLNTPTLVALVWFSVSERELAMTLLTLNNTLGNAIGSILPSIMVPPLDPDVNHQDLRVNVSFLILVQFSASLVGMLFAYNLFANQPPIPPSRAAEKLREDNVRAEVDPDDPGYTLMQWEFGLDAAKEMRDRQSELAQAAGDSATNAAAPPMEGQSALLREQERPASGMGSGRREQNVYESYGPKVREDMWLVVQNGEYLKLVFGLSMFIGTMNSGATLLGQLPTYMEPQNIGFIGFCLIVSGFLGSLAAGTLLGKTKKYNLILKAMYILGAAAWAGFMLSCHDYGNTNFAPLLIAASMAGFFVIGSIPATLQSAVEVTYPIPEEISVGLLFSAANTAAIPFTFIGQSLLANDLASREGMDNTGTRYPPYAIFSSVCVALGMLAVVTFKGGQYNRLNLDVPPSPDHSPLQTASRGEA